MTPEQLSRTLEDFLAGSREAAVTENGQVQFDLSAAKYSISGEHNKCLLHLWSPERNIVRRILDLEIKKDVLRMSVQRLGQAHPARLEICRRHDQRTPTAKRAARAAYRHRLERLLQRRFAGFTIAGLRTSADLERSFGPVYTRGLIRRGQAAFAVLGVNAEETQVSIDAALTFGILWLDLCREQNAGKLAVEGLKMFVPAACSAVVRQRMGQLDPSAAKWSLYEFDEREDALAEIDLADCGNLETRLTRFPDEDSVRERFAGPIGEIKALMPEVAVAVLSPAEIAFRLHGLEFARARLGHAPDPLRAEMEIVFGLGAAEQILTPRNQELFERLVRSIGEARHAGGPHDHLCWRLHPERWLESLISQNVEWLDERLDSDFTYSQVPAFSACDRGMIDLLSLTREGRLAVIELKADEDIHLPLQGLDYWSRVAWHHARGAFPSYGYFPGRELSAERPLLLLVAPALRIHPATDTILRYLSSEIDWALLAINENWREDVKVVFRKRSHGKRRAAAEVA